MSDEVFSDCRSEEGITIGLLDSMIYIARILAKRDLMSENTQSALRDFRNDEDIKFLIGNETEVL